MDEAPKRGRGRPKGAKNRVGRSEPPKSLTPRLVPPGFAPLDDYRHADPLTMVAKQYAMIDYQQQALNAELRVGLGAAEGVRSNVECGLKLVDVGNALMKTMNAHKSALALAETLAKNKTPAEMLEIAIRKVEGQDLPTLEAIIKRLRKHRARLAPTTKPESIRMGDAVVQASAMDGMHSLGDSDEL